MMTSAVGKAALQETGCCDCGLEEIVIKVAIVAAVIGIAVAIFTCQYFAAIGFALFGAISIWKYYETTDTLDQIAKMSGQIGLDVETIKASTEKVAELTVGLGTVQREFGEQRERFASQVKSLQDENVRLHTLGQGLGEEKLQLDARVSELNRIKEALQEQLGALQVSHDQMALQLKGFLEANLELGKSVAAFDGAGKDLKGTEQGFRRAISAFDSRFDENREEFSAALETGRVSVGELSQYIAARYAERANESGTLRDEVEALKGVEKRLVQSTAELQRMAGEYGDIKRKMEEFAGIIRGLQAKLKERATHLGDTGVS